MLRRLSIVIILGLVVSGCESLPNVFNFPLSDDQVEKIAKEITVTIDGCNSAGSGVIYDKNGDTYSVLTADHVVKKAQKTCLILTSDEGEYKASTSQAITPINGVDLAILKFVSKKSYTLAKLGDSKKAIDKTKVYVAGSPESTEAIPQRIVIVKDGKIIDRKLQTKGYDLIYNNETRPGMSGGPVLNQEGQVIGIHGHGGRMVLKQGKI